jgi:hypothetical protein
MIIGIPVIRRGPNRGKTVALKTTGLWPASDCSNPYCEDTV